VTVHEFRSRWILPIAIFFGTFAWSFVYVSLPFYIQRISTVDEASTLRWTGWILGISNIVTVVTGPFWGRLAGQGNPKQLYVLVEVLQGLGFFLMALARTLPELFLARAVLGIMGAASTFAFIMAGRGGEDVRRDVTAIQSALTVGQVVGPLAGAVAAARIGFWQSFIAAGLILWGCGLLVWRGVPYRPGVRAHTEPARPASIREVGTVCLLVLAGSTQVFFLTAILPQILPPLGVAPADTLEIGGLIIFATGIAAALGSMAAPRLADLVGDRRTVLWFLAGSSVLLASMSLAPGLWSFGTLRFLQVLCIAPIFPISVAAIAQRASGEAIGFVNSSRIGAAFLGPVIATTVLAVAPPAAVYLTLAACGLAVLPVLLGGFGRRGATEGSIS
jgi:MFS family permease